MAFDAHLYLGASSARGGFCTCPDSQEWIAEELRKESSVAKERRKAREERALLRPKAEPKGKSKAAPKDDG